MTKLVKGLLIAAVAVVVLFGIAIGLVIGLAIYGHNRAVQAGNQEAAMRNLDAISIAQIRYYTEHGGYGTFEQLVEKGFLDRRFAGATPSVDGYIYVLRVTTASAGQKPSFTLNADPENTSAGTKHFFIDDTNSTVRVNPNKPASTNDPPFLR